MASCFSPRRAVLVGRRRDSLGRLSVTVGAVACLLFAGLALAQPAREKQGGGDAAPKARPAPKYGPALELRVNGPGATTDTAVDLDTGRLLTPPDGLPPTSEALTAWCRDSGVDSLSGGGPEGLGLRAVDLAFQRVPRLMWDWSPIAAAPTVRGMKPNPLTEGAQITAPKGFPATFVFRTREGSVGVLQVTGIDEAAPGAVIICCKAVGPEAVEQIGSLGDNAGKAMAFAYLGIEDDAVRTELLKATSSASWYAREKALGRSLSERSGEEDPRVGLMLLAFRIRDAVQSGRPDAAEKRAVSPKALHEMDDLAAYPDWAFSTVSVLWTDTAGRVVCRSTGGGPPGPEGEAVLVLDFVRVAGREGEEADWKLADSDLEPGEDQQEEILAFAAEHSDCRQWTAPPLTDPYFEDLETDRRWRPDLARAREEARITMRKAHLHFVGEAIRAYRADHGGAYPERLDVIYDRYLDKERRIDPQAEGGLQLQYVVPDTDAPEEIVLYYWPPLDGTTGVLYQDGRVEQVTCPADGRLVNARNGEVVRAAEGSATPDTPPVPGR